MKSKINDSLPLLLAGACAANLECTGKNELLHSKWSDNIFFVSVGGGIHAINNDGFNKIARISACQLVS